MGDDTSKAEAYIEIARQRVGLGDEKAGIEFFSRALSLDPKRLDVHVDLAELEIKRGKVEAAIRRLDAVAGAYEDAGQHDMAEDVRTFAAALDGDPGSVENEQTGMTEPMGLLLPTPRQGPREETVIAKTILRFPDGSPMPVTPKVAAPSPQQAKRARFRVTAPPSLRRPRQSRG